MREHDEGIDCCLATGCLHVFVLGLRGDIDIWLELMAGIGDDWLIAKHKTRVTIKMY